MSSSEHMSRTREPPEIWIPSARPLSSAFFLGALLVLIAGSAIAIPFLIPSSNFMVNLQSIKIPLNIEVPLSTLVAGGGAVISLAGLISLVSGNARRLRLINDFTASAYELNARLTASYEARQARQAERREESYFQFEAVAALRDYEDALLRLSAYEQAHLVSRLIEQNGGRFPYNDHRRRRLV